jgi:hypothetical protein
MIFRAMDSLTSVIREACEWVSSKGNGGRDSCKVSTDVRWADWDKKVFSPAMCVLWWGEVKSRGVDGYDTFWIPRPETWTDKVAGHLKTSHEWVTSFVDQCHGGTQPAGRWTVTVSLDDIDDLQVRNPKVEWRHEDPPQVELSPEAKYCIERYGNTSKKDAPPPYWTKDPPVELYSSKLIRAAADLHSAIRAADR